MKIKKSITDRVKTVVCDCRDVLTRAIIELCQLIDKNESGKVFFERPFMLTTSKPTSKDKNFKYTSEHLIVNSIFYGPVDRMSNCFILSYDDEGVTSSFWLSLGDLHTVYGELLKTVRHE